MYTTYILQSIKTQKYYVGYTGDLEKRLKYHNTGKNQSTKSGMPWQIVYTELFSTKHEAWKREYQIKSYKGGEGFKKLIKWASRRSG